MITSNIKKNTPSLDAKKMLGAVDLGMTAGAVLITADAKKRAPRDTGLLANSIFWTRIKAFVYRIGTPVHYAPYMELGTQRVKAKPYLRPAAFNNVQAIVQLISQYLSKVL